MDFATKDPLEELATAPLPSSDPGVQLKEAEQGALSGSEPQSLPQGAVAAPPGIGALARSASSPNNANAVAQSLASTPQAGVTVTKKDVTGVALDAAKKFGGDAIGQEAFKRGTWNYGETGGNTAKGLASAKFGALVNAAKIATAKPGDEQNKAIAGLAGDALADATSAGGKLLAGTGKVGGEAIKGIANIAFAKTKDARTEAIKDAGAGVASEAAGAVGGPVAKAAVSALGAGIDVASAPNAADRALRAEKAFVGTAGAIPIVGKPIAQKIIDYKRKAFPFQGEVRLGEDEAKVSSSAGGDAFGGTLLSDGSIRTADGQVITSDPQPLTEADKRRLDRDTEEALRQKH